MRYILILILIICIGVGMGITKFSPEDITALRERLWRMEQDIKNLKMERKVYFSDAMKGQKWIDWAPTYSAGGDMTYTDVTTNYARYCIIEGILFFMICAYGTTGEVANPTITFTLPKNPIETNAGGCMIIDNNDLSGIWLIIAGNKIAIKKYDEANWGLGAARGFHAQGFYRPVE